MTPRRSATVLGIDIGTGSTKAVAFSSEGESLGAARSTYPTHRPAPGWIEQDPADWLDSAEFCVDRIAEQVDLSAIRAIGVTGQNHTHALVDDRFTPLLRAPTWQDVRTAPIARGLADHSAELGGRPPDPTHAVARALWFARHESHAWAQSRWLLLPKDLLVARLTGVAATDPLSCARLTASIDRDDDGSASAAADYLPGLALAPGLPHRLPPLVGPEEPVGALRQPWSGIAPGTPVVAGTFDSYAGVLGSGLRAPGDTMVTLGTSATVAAVASTRVPGHGVIGFPPYRGRRIHGGPTQAGGDALRWWAAASGHGVADVLASAEAARPGSDVLFAPHLAGERAPLWDDTARAWFTGIEAATEFAELSLAVLEGVAYSVRELLEAVRMSTGARAGRTVVSGGGARSRLWCQLLADVTGLPLLRAAQLDTAVTGAAVLAAAALTGDDPWNSAISQFEPSASYDPRPGSATRHDDRFARYRRHYQALRDSR